MNDQTLAKVEATSSNLVTRSKPLFYLHFDLANMRPRGKIIFSFRLNPSKKFNTFVSKVIF